MGDGYTPPTKFREWLSRLFRHHVMLHEYCPDWDHYLRVAIELGMVKPAYFSVEDDPEWFSDSTVTVGDKVVWAGNYPYAYGIYQDRRPSYETIKLLRKVQLRLIKENKERMYKCWC